MSSASFGFRPRMLLVAAALGCAAALTPAVAQAQPYRGGYEGYGYRGGYGYDGGFRGGYGYGYGWRRGYAAYGGFYPGYLPRPIYVVPPPVYVPPPRVTYLQPIVHRPIHRAAVRHVAAAPCNCITAAPGAPATPAVPVAVPPSFPPPLLRVTPPPPAAAAVPPPPPANPAAPQHDVFPPETFQPGASGGD